MGATLQASMVNQVNSIEMQNCARESIHQIQTVQSHAFLIACQCADGRITFVSENASFYLEAATTDLIGQSIFDLLEQSFDTNLAILSAVPTGAPFLIDLQFRFGVTSGERFEVLAHRIDATLIIEVMPFKNAPMVSVAERSQIEMMVKSVDELHRQKSLDDFLNTCVAQIRQLSGYQRVFIYRFLPDWSGEVIAESTAPGCDSRFLGLRFPAADIPEQARALYRVNLLRIIGDVDAEQVPLLSDATEALLDQSNSLSRSPSPMHLRYLRNMGVKATMTISLLKEGELWGMVSCHHDTARVPPTQIRRITKLLCTLLAEVAAVRLDALLHQEILNKTLRFRDAMNQFVREIGSGKNFPQIVEKALGDVSAAMKVGDFGLMLGGRWLCVPEADASLLAFLLSKARALPIDAMYATNCLRAEPYLAEAVAEVEIVTEIEGVTRLWAGALVVAVPGLADSFLLLLRREVIQEVRWGGAPGKEKIELANGLQVLGPRHSFDCWTQVVQGQCDAWTADEQLVVHDLAKTLGDAHQAYSKEILQAELGMLGSCMEHLNDLVIVTDTVCIDEPGPTIIYVNQAFITKTGYSSQEVVGRSPRFLQGPATDRRQLEIIRQAMQVWRPVTVELVNYRKNGEPFWVELSLAPIADCRGGYSHWVAIVRDIDERKRNEKAMQQLADFDLLTGLPNRRLLMDRLPVALSVSKRYGHNGALLFVDLDHFKDLNDTEGHHVGDELLKQVAQRLVAAVRLEDTVARLGGDEFVVMLENLSTDTSLAAASAQQAAEKIISQLARPYDLNGHTYSNTASLGISLFPGIERQSSLEDIFKQADFAMYQSKSAGRNTWRFFDPKMQAALVEKNALESDMKQAFAGNCFSLHYQPIVNFERTIVGVEALMRWQHATRGWVSPADFIPIAEYALLIVPMGCWAIAQACAMLNIWSIDPLRSGWSISVNVSAPQVRETNFVATVERLLVESGCNPAYLKLELTESLLQHDFDTTIAKMEALRALGVAFAIDDFGTGYSSLAYLQRLPISTLKIDRSFVRNIGDNAGDRAICKMILALGQTLGLSIVAEGVETMDQFEFLKSHHCDMFQGFLFSESVCAEKLEDVVADLQV